MLLICLPYAGGSAAAYSRWERKLGAGVGVRAVELPGRGRRIREAPLTSSEALVEQLLIDLAADLEQGPFALFGHSMGGLLAFQLTHALVDRGLPGPQRLVLSAARAPGRTAPVKLHALPDEELIETLGHLSGAPAEALAHEDLMEVMLPVVRADLKLAETWSFDPAGPLSVPVALLGGLRDPLASPAELERWRPYFAGEVERRSYPGDHFYLLQEEEALLRDVRDCISARQ
jgi:medium-chain acyl-[acyl-carrier-protein] hydrolase